MLTTENMGGVIGMPPSLRLKFDTQDYRLGMARKSFSDLITFSRSGGAGRFNAEGKYEWVAANVPRIDYDPVTRACRGLLIEEQRTNLLVQSGNLAATDWVKQGASVVADGAFAGMQSYRCAVTSAGVQLRVRASPSTVAAGAYVATVYVRPGTFDKARLFFDSSAANYLGSNAVFNMTTGLFEGVSTGLSAVAVGGGWWRITLVVTLDSAGSLSVSVVPGVSALNNSAEADIGKDVIFCAPQLEAGAFPTSYIPTTTAAVTRSHDSASLQILQPWLNQSQGTFLAIGRGGQESAQGGYGRLIGVGPSQAILSRMNTGNIESWDGSSAIRTSNVPDVAKFVTRAALAYDSVAAKRRIVANGLTPIEGGYSGFEFSRHGVALGRNANALGNLLNGHLHQVDYYPTASLTNAQLQELTQ